MPSANVIVAKKASVKKNARQIADEYFAMTRNVSLGKSETIKDLIKEGRN